MLIVSPMTEPTIRRPDISEGLIHLTKETGSKSAFEVLKSILISGKLKASTKNSGFIKGTGKAVCFSEAPLSAVQHLIARSIKETEGKVRKRYSTYGLAVSKESIYELGGRPVIYLPNNEAEWVPDDQKWRQVRFEYPDIDWTHEREWRLPLDLKLNSVRGIYVLVSTATEAKEIHSLQWPYKEWLRGVLPMEQLNRFL